MLYPLISPEAADTESQLTLIDVRVKSNGREASDLLVEASVSPVLDEAEILHEYSSNPEAAESCAIETLVGTARPRRGIRSFR